VKQALAMMSRESPTVRPDSAEWYRIINGCAPPSPHCDDNFRARGAPIANENGFDAHSTVTLKEEFSHSCHSK
jgi:hypothetical protein